MTGDERGSAPAIRLWWAAPMALVVLTGIVFVAVFLPALAGSAHVPSQLVVHRSPAPTSPGSPTTSVSPSASPRPTPSTPAPPPTHSTTVVPPQRPVVRESDDRHEGSNQGDRSGGRDG